MIAANLRVEIEHYFHTLQRSTAELGRGSYVAGKNTDHVHTACMNPALNGSSALERFKHDNEPRSQAFNFHRAVLVVCGLTGVINIQKALVHRE